MTVVGLVGVRDYAEKRITENTEQKREITEICLSRPGLSS